MAAVAVSSLGHEMEHMIRSKDNGIHKCFSGRGFISPNDRSGGVVVQFSGAHHPKRHGVKLRLEAYKENVTAEDGHGDACIRSLLPFQVEAVLNVAFRPTQTFVTKTILMTYAQPPRTIVEKGTSVLHTPDDDVGMLVINDLYTGSGKTLTTILGAIIFAIERRDEIVNRVPFLMREQSRGNWGTRVQCPVETVTKRRMTMAPKYTNAVVVMCAKHLFSQWKAACVSALRILGMVDVDDIKILENPLPGSPQLVDGAHGDRKSLKIILLHSDKNLSRLDLEFVPVIVVDEFTVKSTSNVLTKSAELLPLHGRMIWVSADAGNIDKIIPGAHRRSYLRNMIQWEDICRTSDSYISMVAGIPLISASVLPTGDRYRVGELMIDQLKKVKYEKYVVRYTPSFASRLFGSNFEMSAISGSRLISDRFGIVLSGTKTVTQVLQIVSSTVETLCAMDGGSRVLSRLTALRDKLITFSQEKEACPVCLEEYQLSSGASLINPCWHIVCDKCLRGMMTMHHTKCPICRTNMEGHTTAIVGDGDNEASAGATSAVFPGAGTEAHTLPHRSLIDNMNAILKPTAGLDKACIDTLRCIQAEVGDLPYKVVMIVPDEHFFANFTVSLREQEGMDASQVQIIEFKTSGSKRKHVTGNMVVNQLASFASDAGPPLKVLFTTEGKTDSLTGLDFPRVDCIISLGEGNSLQRLGRLTRLPRMIDDDIARKVVRYISLEPVY